MLTPPTDSLYKFLAVFGLVLVVTGFIMQSQARRSFNEALVSMMVENAKVGEQELAQSKRVLELVKQLKNYDSKTIDGSRQQRNILEEIERPELHRSAADLELSGSFVRAKKTYDFATAEYLKTAHESVLLWMAGFLVAATGFYLWYFKIQRFLDKQLSSTGSREQTVDHDRSA